MQAGFYEVDITPRVGVGLAGFGPYLNRMSIAVRDPLKARAAALALEECLRDDWRPAKSELTDTRARSWPSATPPPAAPTGSWPTSAELFVDDFLVDRRLKEADLYAFRFTTSRA